MTDMKKQGAGILMSTHILATAEPTVINLLFYIMEVRAQGTLKDLQEEFQMRNATLDEIYIELTKEEGYE